MSCEEDPRKCVRELRVVLTPLTGVECDGCVERLKKWKAEKVEEQKKRRLERKKAWKKANPEKVKAQKKRWRERNQGKVREWKRRDRKVDPEKERERKRKWREANPEKVKEQRRKSRAREKARLEADEERMRAVKEKVREQKLRYRQANREKLRERQRKWREANREKVSEMRRKRREREKAEADEERWQEIRRKARERQRKWRLANPKKLKAQREQYREADRVRCRRYHEAHREECNRARRERYARQKGRPVPPPPPPPPPPCDCGSCLACGGWGVTWQPAWHARLKAFSAKKDQPPVALEDLPLDLLESEAETLSTVSTSEIDSEWGDRLETLLADESDSEVETGPATAPTRQSTRIAAMPAVSYQDWEEENPMLEMLKRKAQLHAEADDRIVTRWELLDRRTERVDAIVGEMSVGVDPRHELDRFQSQLKRQDSVMDVMVSGELFDFVDGQL